MYHVVCTSMRFVLRDQNRQAPRRVQQAACLNIDMVDESDVFKATNITMIIDTYDMYGGISLYICVYSGLPNRTVQGYARWYSAQGVVDIVVVIASDHYQQKNRVRQCCHLSNEKGGIRYVRGAGGICFMKAVL